MQGCGPPVPIGPICVPRPSCAFTLSTDASVPCVTVCMTVFRNDCLVSVSKSSQSLARVESIVYSGKVIKPWANFCFYVHSELVSHTHG